jgi:hypothetical protein
MSNNNTFSRLAFVMAVALIVLAWGAPLFAQYGSSSKSNSGGSMNKSTSTVNQNHTYSTNAGTMGGNAYLIMIPASSTANTCQDILKDFSSNMSSENSNSQNKNGNGRVEHNSNSKSQGSSDSVTRRSAMWRWGCSTDDKSLYVFTNAPNESAALEEVPADLRAQAKVISMNSMSESHSNPKMEHNSKSTTKSQPSSGGMNYYTPFNDR